MRRDVRPRPAGLRSTAVLLALALGTALSSGAARPAEAAGTDLTGRMAPEISVPIGLHGLAAGTTLASMRGHVVVLKFFFVGCPTCRDSMPAYQSLYARYAPLGVNVLAIAYDDRASVESFVDRMGYTFPVGVDPNGVTSARYGVRTYPTDYVIGADGVVLAYDTLSTSVIDRALLAARAQANVEELGSVPAALAGATQAARDNDYGTVLRLVEAHLDAEKDGAEVAAAAARIRGVAKRRFDRRVARVRARFDGGDRLGAAREARAVAADFRGTSSAGDADALVADLERRAGLVPASAPR